MSGDLPKTWVAATIVEVLVPNGNGKPFQQGWSPQCEKTPAEPDEWGVLKTTAIQEGEFLETENKRLPDALEFKPHLEVNEGDILMTCAGPRSRCGVTCLVRRTRPKLMISGKMYRFRTDSERILPEYLESYLLSRDAKHAIDRMKTGISDSGLNLTHSRFAELFVPVAPLNEQRRIVAKIEALLSQLGYGIESLKLAREQLKVYRQAVLDAAFKQISDVKSLKELLSTKISNGYSGKPVRYKTKTKVLSLSSTTSGVFKDEYFKYLDEDCLDNRDIWCEPNDILIQRGNTIEYVGVPAIYTGKAKEFIFPDLMIRVRADDTIIDTKYLYYALSSPRIRNYLRSKAKGSAGTMPKISQPILSSVDVPFCALVKQRTIVQDVENKISHILAMETEIEEHLSKAEVLRFSILKRAFSGRLLAQDPNDEPIVVLPESAQAQKTGRNTNKKNESKNEKNEAA